MVTGCLFVTPSPLHQVTLHPHSTQMVGTDSPGDQVLVVQPDGVPRNLRAGIDTNETNFGPAF